MTKNAAEFTEFDGHVGCREYTLPRDDESSTPRGWIRGNTKIGLVLEVVTNYHQGKPGIEIRLESLSGDNSQSRIRESNGLNKFVRDLTEKTRAPGDDENSSATAGHLVIQESRIATYSQTKTDKSTSKTKPKPTSNPLPSSSTEQIPIHGRKWIGVEPQEHTQNDAQSYLVSKRMIALLRHVTIPRDED